MYRLTLAAVVVSAVTLAGCSSTPKLRTELPTIAVVSSTPYVWDDSISDALNIARMAQPAGVGIGMRDFADGTKAHEGKTSTAGRLFDAALGAMTIGVIDGVLTNEVITSKADQGKDWNPSIIDLVPIEAINDANGNPDLKKAQEYIGSKVRAALTAEYPDMKWYGSFTPAHKRINNFNTAFNFYSESACKDSIAYSSTNKEKALTHYDEFHMNLPIENVSHIDKYCSYGGMLSITSTHIDKGVEKYVVVLETQGLAYFDRFMATNYEGFFIVPRSHKTFAEDAPVNLTINRPAAIAFRNGEQLLFQSK